MELRAAVVDVIEIQDPSQDSADRLGDVVSCAPVGMPCLEAFARGIALQVEQGNHKQRALRRHLGEELPFFEVLVQSSGHRPHQQIANPKGLWIAAVHPHQRDVRRDLAWVAWIVAKAETAGVEIGPALIKRQGGICCGLQASVGVSADQPHGLWVRLNTGR